MAAFIYLFKGNINQAYIASHFVIPPILFLLFFFLGKVLIKNNLWSYFLALVGVFTPIFRGVPDVFKSLSNFLNIAVKNFYPPVSTPLDRLFLDKTPDQLLTYLIYIPAIAFLLIFWRKPSKKNAAIAGVLIGLLVYTYLHYWVYLTIIAGLIFIFSVITFKKHIQRLKAASVLVGILFLVISPYLINIFALNALPHSSEMAQRMGIVNGYYFHFLKPFSVVFDYSFYFLLAILVYLIFYKKYKDTAILYWILIVGLFIVWNVQLVVGYTPQPDHWFRALGPIIFVILLHILYELSKKINYKFVATVLIILSIFLVIKKVVNAVIFVNPPQEFLDAYAFNPNIVDSWKWINGNLQGEPKIISPSFITSIYLVAQTAARPYLATSFSTASNQELEKRFLIAYKAFNVQEETLKRVSVGGDLCWGEGCEFNDYHEWANIIKPMKYLGKQRRDADPSRMEYRYVSPEGVNKLIEDYKNSSRANWRDLSVDYIYYGPWERQLSDIDLENDQNLILVYKNPEVEIYKIKR